MSLLSFAPSDHLAPILVNEPVTLRPPQFDDYDEWTRLREGSRTHLTEWEPDWRASEMSMQAFRQRVRGYWREIRRGRALPLLVFEITTDAMVGGVNLGNIRMGAACTATLGYWIGRGHLRRGFARASVAATLDHGFGRLGLNRIEAACQPANRASLNLLESLGFEIEGEARDYLYINGAWRDHLLLALTARRHCEIGTGLGAKDA